MGCGIYAVDQVPADGSGAQRIVLTLEDLETPLAWVGQQRLGESLRGDMGRSGQR